MVTPPDNTPAETTGESCAYVMGDDGLATWSDTHADAWIGMHDRRFLGFADVTQDPLEARIARAVFDHLQETIEKEKLEQALAWLHRNSLTVDPDKTELITFVKQPWNPDLIGGQTQGVCYTDPVHGLQQVSKSPQVQYLGLFLDRKMTWQHHIDIMASRACSTI